MRDPQTIKAFAFAGRAVLTLRSKRTSAHYTYRLCRKPDASILFVSLLTGPEEYNYLGTIFPDGFRLTAKSTMRPDSTPVRAFQYFLRNLSAGTIPEELEVRHEGRCGKCGRPLTHPESIDTGLGPICGDRS